MYSRANARIIELSIARDYARQRSNATRPISLGRLLFQLYTTRNLALHVRSGIDRLTFCMV